MALTKIGATLGGSADVITVTQNSHGLTLGYPVKMTSGGYAHATADSAANAEVVGIIIATTTNTLTIALGGRITVDGCVPNVTAGTVLFLQVSAGLLAATEPSSAGQISKPMAVVTVANSEMIMVQQRGEVISTGAATIADDAITTAKILNDAVTADKLANSINTEIAANTAKVTNATHTGDVTGATSLTIANGAVDIAHLSASGSAGSGTFLRGDNQWAAGAGIPSGVILMWHGLIANIPSGWVLCNGSNGTPDLRGQFTQGAANGVEAGATGGSATAAPSAHSNHSVTQPSAHASLASHQHSVPLGTGNGNNHNIMIDHNEYGAGNSYSADRRTLNIGVNGNWSTTGTLTQGVAAGTPDSHSGTAVDAHSAHSISDSRPPFYTILYIMKT